MLGNPCNSYHFCSSYPWILQIHVEFSSPNVLNFGKGLQEQRHLSFLWWLKDFVMLTSIHSCFWWVGTSNFVDSLARGPISNLKPAKICGWCLLRYRWEELNPRVDLWKGLNTFNAKAQLPNGSHSLLQGEENMELAFTRHIMQLWFFFVFKRAKSCLNLSCCRFQSRIASLYWMVRHEMIRTRFCDVFRTLTGNLTTASDDKL